MMYYLLNNFHYLFYEEDSLRDDDSELERYHRIVRYISNNYMEKISLQEIADQEFLTSQYLSYKIKNTFGYGFNDFLNSTRIEESVKLLLGTSMNMSEISQEVGFSHVRYYNKHFKNHYNLSPMEYRKKHKVSKKQLKQITKFRYLPLEDALPYLTTYLDTYERYEYDDKVKRYDIDVSSSIGTFTHSKTLYLGSAVDICNFRKHVILIEKIKKLNFEYGAIDGLESFMTVPLKEQYPNWHFIDNILDYVFELELKPIFILNNNTSVKQINLLKNYLNTHRSDLDTEKISFVSSKEFYSSKQLFTNKVDERNDTLYSVGDVFTKNFTEKEQVASIIDTYQQTITTSDTFYGGTGLLTYNEIMKPSYYSFMFLSHMGENLIFADQGIIVTSSENGFEVLLFDPIAGKEKKSHVGQRKRYSINITNMQNDYKVIKYELHKDSGSAYDKWIYLGKPQILDKQYLELLKQSAVPEIKFYYASKNPVYNIFTTIKDRGAALYLFKVSF